MLAGRSLRMGCATFLALWQSVPAVELRSVQTAGPALVVNTTAEEAAAVPKKKKHHRWDFVVDKMVKAGEHVDSFFQEARETFQISGEEVQKVLNRKCEGASTGDQSFLIDNSQLNAQTNGIGFRFSKKLTDRDLRAVAHWGSVVQGKDLGDGWLQVGDCFLPTKLQGIPVVKLHSLEASAAQEVSSFTAGEAAEVKIEQGPWAGTWMKCSIIGQGQSGKPNTFEISVPSPTGQEVIHDIATASLRKVAVDPSKI